MAKIPEYPPLLTGNDHEDIRNIRAFLERMVRTQVEQQQENERAAANSEEGT